MVITHSIIEKVTVLSKKLKLHNVPALVPVNGTKQYAFVEFDAKVICGIVTATSFKYEICIDNEQIKKLHQRLVSLVNNNDIVEDCTMAIIRHELRHLWQLQHDFHVGKLEGETISEIDADKWMVNSAPSLYEKTLARYIKALHEKQSADVLVIVEEELKKAYQSPKHKFFFF